MEGFSPSLKPIPNMNIPLLFPSNSDSDLCYGFFPTNNFIARLNPIQNLILPMEFFFQLSSCNWG